LGPLLAVYTHPLVAPWIGGPTRREVAEALEFYVAHQAARGWAFWAVEDRATGRFLGDCGLQPFERRGPEVELGYDLHPDAWGKGLATEAARAALHAGLGALGFERVIAVVRRDHRASRRVLEKAGLVRSGERPAYGVMLLLYEAARRTADRSGSR